MEPALAKSILARWRPGPHLTDDPAIQQARAVAENDPHLGPWLDRHSRFQQDVTEALRSLPVPDDLASRILAAHRIHRPVFRWTRPLLVAAAAGIIAAALWIGTLGRIDSGSDYSTFRRRMVRTVTREYRMDITTPDVTAIRSFLARNSAPSDFELPPPLARLSAVGGGTLAWQDHRTAMVCLDGGPDGMLFLFVVPEADLSRAPSPEVEFKQVNKLATGTWSSHGHAYVLASAASMETLRKYL